MVTADEVAAWTVQPAAVALTPQDVAGCRVSTRVRLRDCNVTAYPCHPSHRTTGSEQVNEVPLGAESQHMLNHNDGWGLATYLCRQDPLSNSLIAWARLEVLMRLNRIEASKVKEVRQGESTHQKI